MADESKSRRKRPEDERRPNPAQASFSSERGVFMISVAAELAGMHPQTLRVYETRGLIKPSRSPKQTRLYSQPFAGTTVSAARCPTRPLTLDPQRPSGDPIPQRNVRLAPNQ